MDKYNINGSASKYLRKLQSTLNTLDPNVVDAAMNVIASVWQAGKQIIVFGNGGSAITAQHYITAWNKMIPDATGRPFRGRTLLENLGLITAYANDVSYEDIFLEQLKNILQSGDLVIAISGSGNSENVIWAVQYANEHKAITLGLCGYNGGRLKQCAQHTVHVNINDMQICEDVHAIFCHIVMQTLCGYLGEINYIKAILDSAVVV